MDETKKNLENEESLREKEKKIYCPYTNDGTCKNENKNCVSCYVFEIPQNKGH